MMQLNFSKFNGKRLHELKGQDRIDYVRSVAAFMREPLTAKFSIENTRRIQAWRAVHDAKFWTDKSDFPSGESFYPTLPAISALPFYDEGWKEVFKVLDFTGSGKGGFRQLLLENTLQFDLVPSGGKATVYNIKGSKEMIDFDKYGAALEWDKTLLEDAEWAQIADILTAFRNAAFQNYAEVHYDLIEAVVAAKAAIAWQAADPAVPATDATYNALRDILTINLACQTIALACADKGYGINPQSTFVILTPLQLRGRVRQALGLALQGFGGSPLHLDYNVKQVTTMMLDATDHYIVAFPGARAQSGLRMNLEELTDENILSRSTTQVDWMRFGAGIGDTDQFERCAVS